MVPHSAATYPPFCIRQQWQTQFRPLATRQEIPSGCTSQFYFLLQTGAVLQSAMPQRELLGRMELYSIVTQIILLLWCLVSRVLWLYLVMLAASPQIWNTKRIFLQWSNDTFISFFSKVCESLGSSLYLSLSRWAYESFDVISVLTFFLNVICNNLFQVTPLVSILWRAYTWNFTAFYILKLVNLV